MNAKLDRMIALLKQYVQIQRIPMNVLVQVVTLTYHQILLKGQEDVAY